MSVSAVTGRRGWVLLVALLTAVATLAATPDVASADPIKPQPQVNDEGGSTTVRDLLDAAGRSYLQAKAALETSRKRQAQLTANLADVQRRFDALSLEVGRIAGAAYKVGRLGPAQVLLEARTSDDFFQRLVAVDVETARDDARVHDLKQVRDRIARAKAAIDAEVAGQTRQLAIMDLRKRDAERALAEVGGESTGGFVNVSSPIATQAPRNADGSWPTQRCSVDDPTTNGCITPRLLHALTETKRVGFKRFVSCFRPGGPFEHPKGRACDFSAQKAGFGGVAAGGDRIYGNNLAAFLVRNADRLGVLYVIWFKQIWFPATGWRRYHSGHGDPASDHTNHVHLSVV